MKDLFKPEDFSGCPSTSDYKEDFVLENISEIANAKLNDLIESLIESWPVVYSCKDSNGDYSAWVKNDYPGRKAKAHLAFIEEMPKLPCKHEVEVYRIERGSYALTYVIDETHPKCKHCGVELKAEWSQK